MTGTNEIKNGEIRHSSITPKVIMKVTGPFNAESIDKTGNVVEHMGLYILTNDFPKYHFVVINQVVDSATDRSIKFAVVQLITHSEDYDNLKITEDLYDENTTEIDLTESYITRDLFIINIEEVNRKVKGHFDLIKLKKACEY